MFKFLKILNRKRTLRNYKIAQDCMGMMLYGCNIPKNQVLEFYSDSKGMTENLRDLAAHIGPECPIHTNAIRIYEAQKRITEEIKDYAKHVYDMELRNYF